MLVYHIQHLLLVSRSLVLASSFSVTCAGQYNLQRQYSSSFCIPSRPPNITLISLTFHSLLLSVAFCNSFLTIQKSEMQIAESLIPKTPVSHTVAGACVALIDISGFTKLSETFDAVAGTGGAEKVSQLLNNYFTHLLSIIEQVCHCFRVRVCVRALSISLWWVLCIFSFFHLHERLACLPLAFVVRLPAAPLHLLKKSLINNIPSKAQYYRTITITEACCRLIDVSGFQN